MLYTLRNKCNLIKRFLNQACLFLFVVILFTIELTGCDSRPSYPKTNQNIFLNLKNFIRVLDKKESDTMFKFSFFSWSGNYLPDSNKFVPEIEYFGFLKLVENNALNYSCDSAINDVKFIDFNMNVHDTIYINSFLILVRCIISLCISSTSYKQKPYLYTLILLLSCIDV